MERSKRGLFVVARCTTMTSLMGIFCCSSRSSVKVTTCGCPPTVAIRVWMYSVSNIAFSFWCKEVPLFHSLPAILIGGPPHTGKSVLTYSLSQALRKRSIEHYVIRASPDGEGDWSQ